MVSAISSIENLNVNERIQTKTVMPIKDSNNSEDFTYSLHTPQTNQNNESTAEVDTTPVKETPPVEEKNDLQTIRSISNPELGANLPNSTLEKISVPDPQLLTGDVSNSTVASYDLLNIPSSDNIKTIVVNLKDTDSESVVKKITLDKKGHVLNEETKTTDKQSDTKQKKMSEEKRHINNLSTTFQEKRQNVENLMFQLKQSITNGDIDNIHSLTSDVSTSISSLRSKATNLYNKIYLYESNLGNSSLNQSNTNTNDTENSNENDSAISTSQEEILATKDALQVATEMANDETDTTQSPLVSNSNLTNSTVNDHNDMAATNDINLSINNTSSEKASNNIKSVNRNINPTGVANSTNAQAYVRNISLTDQAAAAAALTINTGMLNIADTQNAHKAHLEIHKNSPVELDMAVEEIDRADTDNPSSSNTDRHDNHETYQQQDMDSGYSSHAINAYTHFNTINQEEFRNKQRKLNNIRYERTNTHENIDLMEDQFHRLSSESNRVINEEKIIAKAPSSIRNQMKQEAMIRRKQRLSFM